MIVILLGIFVTLVYTYFHFKRRRYIDLGNSFPGPKGLPLIGNALSFLNKSPEEIFDKLFELNKTYGDLFRLWFGSELLVVVSDPKQIEGILTNPKIIKSLDYKFLAPWLGNGLLLSEGKKWFQHRKILTPAFHFNILEEFVEIFDLQSNIMVDQLKKRREESVDIVPYLELCTLDIICETAMGTSIDAQKNKNSEYLNAVHKAALITYIRIFETLMEYDFIFSMTKHAKILKNAITVIHNFTDVVIRKRHDELLKIRFDTSIQNNGDNKEKRKALLDILLQSKIDGKPLSNEDIRDEVSTFMFAGHDTTSSAITFVLYNIAKYPDIQEKLFQEIVEVIGTKTDNRITYRHLTELKYLELVIKESLRLFPPAPYFGRQILEETTIDKTTYPAGTNISVAIFLMHRDPENFSDPEKFIPERFDAERTTGTSNPFSYIPFSGGSRNCIGQKFAMLEMKAVAVNILRNFKIKLANENEKIILLTKLILKSKNGIKLILDQR